MRTICKIILFILISLTIDPAFGQRLNGRVKSYRATYYSVHERFGKIKKGPKLNDSLFHDQYVAFNPEGNMIEAIEYYSDSTINSRFIGDPGYDDNNIESIYIRFDPDPKIERKPFILKSVKYPSGEMCEMNYKNDSSGIPVEEVIFDLMGRTIFTIIIKRDERGNPLEYKFSDGYTDQFKYDDQGNRIDWISRAASGHTAMMSYKYDQDGNMIEENINDFFKSSYKYQVDHNTFSYVFDNRGNWTERTEYEHNIPKRIVVRAIEYAN